MFADVQTRRDLELFEARDGGPSIVTTLDRTTTEDGSRRLREIVRAPCASADEIRSRHESLSYLVEIDTPFGVADDGIRRVRKYLESTFTTLPSRPKPLAYAEAAWWAVRYPEVVGHARRGIGATRHLVRSFVGYAQSVASREMPEGLAELVQEGLEIAESLRPLLRPARSAWVALSSDRGLRGGVRPTAERLLAIVAELDALTGAARLLREGFVLPVVDDRGPSMRGEGLWHPFVQDPVGNPVDLEGGDALVFLTGPNMAGKTTYLKSVGVCLYLAHCGLPVPAHSFRFTPVDRLTTGLSPEDNLRRGVSYFLAEVRRVKDVVEAIARGERTVAIFDEVFRGTNVRDALDATRAVLLGCARARTSMFLFSSHLVELADELADHPRLRFCHFEGELTGDRLEFSYRLRPGVSDQRFGMELLRREGLPDLLESIPA
ncbi:MAG: hypothetical protein RLN75_00300 [Longimicrobiales bacterium]